MAERVILTKQFLEEDYHELINEAIKAINIEHNHLKAYDLATQAGLLARKYLNNELYNIESARIRGIAYLGIDSLVGHDLIERLYFENKTKLKNNKDQLIRLELALGASKRIIGEYDEAIRIFSEIYKYAQREIKYMDRNSDEIIEDIRIIIRCYVEISCCLIFKSQQRHYYSKVQRVEDRLKSLSIDRLDSIQELYRYIESPNYSLETNYDLDEAENYLKEALLMSKEHNFKDLELFCMLDYACVLIEKEDYDRALEILEGIKDDPFTQEYLFGYVMDEIGIIYVYKEKFEEAKEIFDRAWNWLCQRNDINEMSRNCFGTALYFFKTGNLDLAYAFAELGYKKDQNLPCLKLLYEICLLKYLSAQRLGNESEYAFYRSEYDRYKLQLERRG